MTSSVCQDVYSGVSSVTDYVTSLESDYMRYIPQGYVKDGHIEKAFLYAFMILEDMHFIIYIVFFISWAVEAAGARGRQPYHIHVPIVLKSGTHNLLEPLGPVQACYRNCFTFTFNILVLIVTSLVGATMSLSV